MLPFFRSRNFGVISSTLSSESHIFIFAVFHPSPLFFVFSSVPLLFSLSCFSLPPLSLSLPLFNSLHSLFPSLSSPLSEFLSHILSLSLFRYSSFPFSSSPWPPLSAMPKATFRLIEIDGMNRNPKKTRIAANNGDNCLAFSHKNCWCHGKKIV